MRLHATITSPFVRKVLVTAHEVGLYERFQFIATNPHADEYLRADNPLCKIPTLLQDGELPLFDSRVVCEYLDSLHDGPKLFPAGGLARWNALRLQALGDGILDANISRRNEAIRPPGEQSPAWIERQKLAVSSAIAWLNRNISLLDGPVTIGSVAIGCALGYFEVRFPNDDWRQGNEHVADWYAAFSARPSMQNTSYRNLKRTLPKELQKEGGHQ
ncbi:glutathione S-transferase [Bradyrhizobium sp. USDA 3256]